MPDNSMVNALKGTIPPDTMPFGVGGPAEPTAESAAPGMVGNFLQGLFHPIKHLVDASVNAFPGLRKEDVTDNPDAPEPNQPMYNASMKTAVDLAGIGMPMAEAGAAGSLGGRLSMTADQKAADYAEKMVKRGQSNEEARRITGWEYHPTDDMWKYEIPGNKFQLKHFPNTTDEVYTGTAGSLFEAPEHFQAYPSLRDINVRLGKDPVESGLYNPNTNTVEIYAPNRARARSVGMHEIAGHGIQDVQGFAPGGNQDIWRALVEKDFPRSKTGAINESKLLDEAYAKYYATSGEAAARNAELRMDYTPLKRLMNSPLGEQFADSPTQYVLDHSGRNILKVLKHNPDTNIIRRIK